MTCVRVFLQSSRTAHLIVIRPMVAFRRHTDQQLSALQAVAFARARYLLLVDLYKSCYYLDCYVLSQWFCAPLPAPPPPPPPPPHLPSISANTTPHLFLSPCPPYDDQFQLITTWADNHLRPIPCSPPPHPTHLPVPFPLPSIIMWWSHSADNHCKTLFRIWADFLGGVGRGVYIYIYIYNYIQYTCQRQVTAWHSLWLPSVTNVWHVQDLTLTLFSPPVSLFCRDLTVQKEWTFSLWWSLLVVASKYF